MATAQTVVIEPQQEMSSHLDAFCRRHADCRWLCCGVSDGDGEQPFTVCSDNHCSSFQYSAADAAGTSSIASAAWTAEKVMRDTADAMRVVMRIRIKVSFRTRCSGSIAILVDTSGKLQ